MGFGGGGSSNPPAEKPEPTYTDQDVDATSQDRRATGFRRVERYETRDAPSSAMVGGELDPPEGSDPTATPRHPRNKSGSPRRRAAQFG